MPEFTAITPEQYMWWYESWLRSQWDEDEDAPAYDEGEIQQQLLDRLRAIESRGFGSWMPDYDRAVTAIKAQGLLQELPEEVSPTEWEREQFEWEKERELWGREQTEEEFALQQRQAQWQRQQAMLPYEQMTLAQQHQARLQQMQEATRLAGLGETGWIERWYAQQARQARFPQREPLPWYTRGGGLAGIAGWEGMRPEERGEWIRRYEKGKWAGMAPEVQEMVEAGYGWPKPSAGEQIGYGETWPGFGAAPQPEWEAARGTTAQFLPSKTISIKPTGEISIKEEGGMPERGRAGQEPTPTSYRDVYLGRPAPTAPVGEAPPRKKGRARARPRPTAPPMPAELAPFLPQAVVGEPIQKGWQIPPPSAQLWGRTPPSTRAMLRGYTQWGGEQPYEDIMWGQQQRQMPTPTGRWGPARQWT